MIKLINSKVNLTFTNMRSLEPHMNEDVLQDVHNKFKELHLPLQDQKNIVCGDFNMMDDLEATYLQTILPGYLEHAPSHQNSKTDSDRCLVVKIYCTAQIKTETIQMMFALF